MAVREWSEWNFGLLDPRVICLALSPDYAGDEIVFAGTESGLYLSRSGGRGWEELALPSGVAPVLSLAVSPEFATDRTVYAGTESGCLLRSNDCGDSWTEIGAGEFDGALNQVLVDRAGPGGRLLILHDAGASISRDGGERWAPCDWVLPAGVSATAVAQLSGLGPGASVLVGCTDGAVRRLTV